MIDLNEIKRDLMNRLSAKRYGHSLRVADEAKRLAHIYHVDEEKAYVAGLVHDVAKEFNEQENRYWIGRHHLSEFLLNREFRKILHAEVGSVVAKELYDVDEEIMQAIRYHTVGNVGMTLFDKIIFVADKIESGKNYPGIQEERVWAYQDIDRALILCLRNQKNKLEGEGKVFHHNALNLLRLLEENKASYY